MSNLDPSIDSHSNAYASSIPSAATVTHSAPYVNQFLTSQTIDDDNFYVMPRQETPHFNEMSSPQISKSDDSSPSTPPNLSEPHPFYATPPAFANNFVLESNLSFDDSEDLPTVTLDTVPDLTNGKSSASNDIYYSYPDHQHPPSQMTSSHKEQQQQSTIKSVRQLIRFFTFVFSSCY